MYEIVKDGKIMPRLKDCPFCNGHKIDAALNDDEHYAITCEKCGATVWGKTLFEAATVWNSRGGQTDGSTFDRPPLLWCKARRLRDDGKRGGWVHGFVRLFKDEGAPDSWQIEDEAGLFFYIDPATVCEYTGLRDSQDKPIYNGDILRRFDKTERTERYVVSYHDGAFWVAATPERANDAPFTVWGLVNNYAAIVVSNLFDSPDAYLVENNV